MVVWPHAFSYSGGGDGRAKAKIPPVLGARRRLRFLGKAKEVPKCLRDKGHAMANYSHADQAYYEQVTREVQEQQSVK